MNYLEMIKGSFPSIFRSDEMTGWIPEHNEKITCFNCLMHSAEFGSLGNNSNSFNTHRALVSLSRNTSKFS